MPRLTGFWALVSSSWEVGCASAMASGLEASGRCTINQHRSDAWPDGRFPPPTRPATFRLTSGLSHAITGLGGSSCHQQLTLRLEPLCAG